jgi:holliday junction DNA helicase RuvA
MISYLKGIILEKGLTYIILEVNGIGYKVFVTPDILENRIGDVIALYTYHKVAEDGQALFGVPDFAALQFFELLITVNGVGPKVALAILSAATVDSVRSAISNQDPAIFTRISGVGTKTAERIIVDLKNKVGTIETAPGLAATSDVFDALMALGYSQREVRDVVNKLDHSLPQQEQIREALKLMGKH